MLPKESLRSGEAFGLAGSNARTYDQSVEASTESSVSPPETLELPLPRHRDRQTMQVFRCAIGSMMQSVNPQEFQTGRYLIRIEAAALDFPGVSGCVGTWHIYRLPRVPNDMPIRYGDTDIVETADMALGMARSIASLIARSL
jgi:hypothetical protein